MDSGPTAESNNHIYHVAAVAASSQWTRPSSNLTTPPLLGSTVLLDPPASTLPTRVDLLPLHYTQQSSLFQSQLLNYNNLISPGRGGGGAGLQTPPLPPVLSAAHIHAAPRSVPPKASHKDDHGAGQPNDENCHGSRSTQATDKNDRAIAAMGKGPQSKMAPPKQPDLSHPLPSRPGHRKSPRPTAQASSVPSTPHQHARNFSFESREASPNAPHDHSPRSAYSETNSALPSLRPLPPPLECRHERALVRGRRRMPYSLGVDRLERIDPSKVKSKLSEDEERKLTTDMRELFDRLIPTEKVRDNRAKLVAKLETLFNEEWPGHDIRVRLFGSSGNKLCSDDSDVDICITTEWKEMERVCMIAELLKNRGMQEVVCVRSAKVPIVKIWDPELKLACDMNVNNPLALENTRMVLTYVEIDERVRPLAMVIKYWTRRRIINDAAFGGTLSSYTWICMIIIFLQLRTPPVLPALHQRPHQRKPAANGPESQFADDLDKLRHFGRKNKETLGELLFRFFRFYAHEFDYDKHVLSVRLGKMITKGEKRWQTATNNMLCIEEPFNTVRNLGNTTDDTSFRGLHMEMRRAFDLISEAKLDECCEQYVFPPEEEKIWQKPPPAPRPVLLRSSSQQHSGRGGRGNFRGRHSHRGNNSRRASSSVAYENNPMYIHASLPQMLSPQDLQWYQQQQQQQQQAQQAQFPYHPDMISSTINALQIQEHSLRFRLYTQSQALAQQAALAHAQRMQGNGPAQQQTERSRTNSFDSPPYTAPIRPEVFMYALPVGHPGAYYPAQPGFATLPSSPATVTGPPEFRRSLHRTSANADLASSGGGPLRSQSQPAVRTPMPGVAQHPNYMDPSQLGALPSFAPRNVNGIPIPSFIPDENADADFDDGPAKAAASTPPEDEGTRYRGYYVGGNSSPVGPAANAAHGIPSFGDLGQSVPGRRRLSTDQLPQTILDRRMRRASRSPSPLGHTRAFSVGTNTAPLPSAPFAPSGSKLAKESRPLVVNGSAFKPAAPIASSRQPSTSESVTSEDSTFDNPLRIHNGLGIHGQATAGRQSVSSAEPSPPFPGKPVVVNGSTHSPVTPQQPAEAQSFHQRIAALAGFSPVPYATVAGASVNGTARQRMLSRQQQNGIAPLDLAMPESAVVPDAQHLSPVFEARTPSPSVLRKPDGLFHGAVVPGGPRKEAPSKPSQISPVEASGTKAEGAAAASQPKLNGTATKQNGHTRAAKSESEGANAWQKPKGRKKGVVVDLKAAAHGTHVEPLPHDEADRKGG